MRLSPIERWILDAMLRPRVAEGSVLLRQPPLLRFGERHMTGKGYFLSFDALPEAMRANNHDQVVSIDLPTNLAAPCHVVGFTLFIREGQITSFEGYTFGSEPWPAEPPESWLASANARPAEQKAK